MFNVKINSNVIAKAPKTHIFSNKIEADQAIPFYKDRGSSPSPVDIFGANFVQPEGPPPRAKVWVKLLANLRQYKDSLNGGSEFDLIQERIQCYKAISKNFNADLVSKPFYENDLKRVVNVRISDDFFYQIKTIQDLKGAYAIIESKFLSDLGSELSEQKVMISNFDLVSMQSRFLSDRIRQSHQILSSAKTSMQVSNNKSLEAIIYKQLDSTLKDITLLVKRTNEYQTVFTSDLLIKERIHRLIETSNSRRLSNNFIIRELKNIKVEIDKVLKICADITGLNARAQDIPGILESIYIVQADMKSLNKRINTTIDVPDEGATAIA